MFENIDDLKEFIESYSRKIEIQHEECGECGGSLFDSCGYEEYVKEDKYAPDIKFCSEDCLEKYLIREIGIKTYM